MSKQARKSVVPAEVAARGQALLAELHASAEPPPRSQRTRGLKRFNPADMIEEQMQECGHEMAGYVVYRITYDSDADWKEFFVRLNAELEHTFELCNGKDILEKFSLTVMDDRKLFNAASTDDVRQHFCAWAAQNYLSEQPQAKDHGEHAVVRVEGSSRYRYAIYADAECLHSIVQGDVVAVSDGRWVKMIRSAWKQDVDDGEEPYEPLEGVTQYDVGWMKVELSSLVEFYEYGYDIRTTGTGSTGGRPRF